MKKLLCILLVLLALCPLSVLATDGVIREELGSLELTRLMGNGTNLGNTFEACDTSSPYVPGRDPKDYEIGWGAPITTQEMLTVMKAAGFDTIRIPVAWMTNATDLANGDYTIEPSYLARVKEVVDYARNADMYVILNDHWDGGWWGMFGSESAETRAFAMEAYKGMWNQIASYFADYSDYLIFEWVKSVPVNQARIHYGNLAGTTATPINRNDAVIAQIESIYITFEYTPQKTR